MLGVLCGLYLIASLGNPYLLGLGDPPAAATPAAKKSGDKAKSTKVKGAGRKNKSPDAPAAPDAGETP